MRITRINNAKLFSSLSKGDGFIFDNDPYIRIVLPTGDVNAINLRTGDLAHIDYNASVVTISAEFTVV